jgi:choline dehydrogenase-like flavoprotein
MNLETPDNTVQFDCIVVGSGAGGGPLAARLAIAGKKVLVVEAGSDHSVESATAPGREVSQVPSLHGVSTEHPELSWRFFVKHYENPPTGPDPKLHIPDPLNGQDESHRGIFYPRAAALGGCTVHNAMITIAGPDSDWDDLADFLGDDSWRGNRMRFYFERLERNEYTPRPTRGPASWLARAWDNVRFLFGFDLDRGRGRHGFNGWLHTSLADLSIGLRDRQLVKMLKAALKESKRAKIDRAWSLVTRFFRGRFTQGLDPNHARTQADSPEGIVLVPVAVCGKYTTIHHNASTPLVQKGRRSSPREFLLETKASHPDNLHIWTDCFVTRVLFDSGRAGKPPRAVGIEFRRGKHLYRAHVSPQPATGPVESVFVKDEGEIVLCGGAFNTPQLLMLSGIGNAGQLAEIATKAKDTAGGANSSAPHERDIDLDQQDKHERCTLRGRKGEPLRNEYGAVYRIDSPGVGLNLQDRYEVTVISEMKGAFSLLDGATFRLPTADMPADRHLKEWRAKGSGLYSTNGAVLGILKRSRPDLAQPDLFIFGIPLPFEGYAVNYSKIGDQHNFFTWTILKGQTRNHDGTVVLRSANPFDTPLVNFHYFNEISQRGKSSDDPDLLALIEGVKFVRRIAKSAKSVKQERYPGYKEVPDGSEDQINKWIRRVAWGHHACGTCRMGPDGDTYAVLNSRFQVRGVDNLRVVDASVFPKIPGYFIVANIYMASEKAADVILQDAVERNVDDRTYPRDLHDLETAAIEQRRVKVESAPAPAVPMFVNAVADGQRWKSDVTGLALSGGGIRSATFNLGILQAFAGARWLRRIDLLSTVSGGGYIGSFLGRFYDRHRENPISGSKAEQSAPASIEDGLTKADSRQIEWLRKHGNYIAPSGPGDARLNMATFLRNFLSVHFVVGMLVFAVFGLANLVRYYLFDQALVVVQSLPGKNDFPIGHLLESSLGPFFSPWFILFELLLLFLVIPRMVGYWIVSQDQHERYQFPPLAIMFLVATVLLYLGVYRGLAWGPLLLALALLSSLIHVEMAWRGVRIREDAVGSGGGDTQRLRTRNYLTYDLGLALALAGTALAFAVIDTVGHGLQQVVEENQVYIKAFASMMATLVALAPITRMAANFLAGDKKPNTPSTMRRIFREQLIAGVLALILLACPLIFYSFTAHAVYQGGAEVRAGLYATFLAIVISLILTLPRALAFVNRSSLAQTYGARLARAYLGASNPLRHRPEGANITEVMAGDDVHNIREYRPHEAGGPLHLINVTVNQTVDFTSQRGNRDRKSENFAVSPLGVSVGKHFHSVWVDPPSFGTLDPKRKRPTGLKPVGHLPGTEHPLIDEFDGPTNRAEMLSLRQWIGISGAAVGPATGQTTRLGTAMLFGLANLRTGHWWDSGVREVARDDFPDLTFLRRLLYLIPRIFPTQFMLIAEWIARYPGPWEQHWYISDGGFFDNMGCYELIRRRVPRIIICDGSADPTYQFDGFAELVRKARIDFHAVIEPFAASELEKLVADRLISDEQRQYLGTFSELAPSVSEAGDSARRSKRHAALFWVRYLTKPTRRSLLLYLKANITGDEEPDIEHYHATHPEFPHESTGDQFFDEAQWESYRRLGEHTASPLLSNATWFWAIPLAAS